MYRHLIAFLVVLATLIVISGCNVRNIARRIYATHIPNAPYDAVIIPGMPYDSATQQKKGFNARIVWAKKLFDGGVVKNIIFSGAACYTPFVEAEVMKLIAIEMGIPKEHLFTEPKAEHSKENVYFGWLLAQQLGFKKVALASDPYQSFFLEGFIQANVPQMGIIPIDVDSLKKYYIPLPKVDLTSAYVHDFVPLNKRESFWTRVKHTNHNNLPEAIPEEYLK
ncbi:MAG: YdcF family protein [Chitinophagales bacterium]|nr:YdcF family protein [Chitinophagales bacterium]